MIEKEQITHPKKMIENGFRKIIQRLLLMYCMEKKKKRISLLYFKTKPLGGKESYYFNDYKPGKYGIFLLSNNY